VALSQVDCITAITEHSAGFADAVRGRLDADVEHCPGWTVADLVAHVVDVHWFWATIVEKRLQEPPAAEERPQRADDDDLVAAFEAGARRLVRVLGEVDQRERLWTWAPAQQDAGFVVRHQVQEIAVHHWDAVNATGGTMVLAPEIAADAADEFLHVSVSSDDDPAEPVAPALEGTVVLRCTDTSDEWLVSDGAAPGTVGVERRTPTNQHPAIEATASDLLLWLYQRVRLDDGNVDPALLTRFRRLTFTD